MLARALANIGIYMGCQFLPPNMWNPDGYWEDVCFYRLNESILARMGKSWDNPPTVAEVLENVGRFVDEARSVVSRHVRDMWGWKDPRNSILLPIYMPILESIPDNDIYLIAIFRRVDRVAASLARRDGFTREKSARLYRLYNASIIYHILRFVGIGYEELPKLWGFA